MRGGLPNRLLEEFYRLKINKTYSFLVKNINSSKKSGDWGGLVFQKNTNMMGVCLPINRLIFLAVRVISLLHK